MWRWTTSSWSGRVDSNHRPQRPERCALTKLRYAPYPSIIVDRPGERKDSLGFGSGSGPENRAQDY